MAQTAPSVASAAWDAATSARARSVSCTCRVLRYFTERNDGLGERLQAAFPSLKLVKAFNTVGAAFFVRPTFAQGRGSMFIAGNDADAKAAVAGLIEAWGWQPYDVGRIEGARVTEPLCQLWCLPGFLRNDWAHAFQVIA
ncbi:MAG: hypothetical protein JNL93_23350 [Pelomonas sp.]|nr:hypothetical protein [Roseateles sp.]